MVNRAKVTEPKKVSLDNGNVAYAIATGIFLPRKRWYYGYCDVLGGILRHVAPPGVKFGILESISCSGVRTRKENFHF